MANTLKFTDAEKLQADISEFWVWCDDNKKRPTLTRLASYLNTNRMTLLNYRNEIQSTLSDNCKHNILLVLSRAMADLEADAEDRLYDRDTANGAKFALTNNYGWSERSAVDIGGDGLKVELSPELQDWAK